MYLNTIKPAEGSKKVRKRVGRGIGSTLGKTCGRGHKGQKSRSGGFHKVGFEGGQMPLQRRLPKVGFTARKSKFTSEVRLNEIAKLSLAVVTLDDLIKSNIVPAFTKVVKVIKSGEITSAVTLKGLKVTVGAKALIEAAGGTIED
ncbi:50S ribosomal protein L15 [methanotrophic endosymbiont of Bathymodiolus puteoserpentis (Logatchev)]|jgi:large subunit ribosomal protein L15|uniref:50S ribosomal protein L15 n=1 Tax=methanotrophic endosymbiont of Bathymodiolus puteoserpentis (Logatchev) TaxID=343235 RepID=UPI0008691D33|nr:50S ribosomal protein L15 [methanotrophic endosymbiont of Bathymodiolus puteoserpentis (Logatchev)]SCN46937.1 LSU ribosomal protein L15p (L27Ae) [methanotrophic endosymbiont of Bathymodiolus azoricus (Menez Gwen)]SHE21283.1 LSU ribosomal protein L15p (L27Ae) [methanotrophic endosymbiont of Bathymodiolus puteoserpentis (Logatchev)]